MTRTVHMPRLVVLAVLLWGPCASPTQGEPYRHTPSGFECPDEIAGFIRTDVHDFEKEQPGLGIGCTYRLSSYLIADVYVFSGGRKEIPADAAHPAMAELRVPNIMTRVRVAVQIVDDEEDAEERIGNTFEAFDDGRRDFGRNPKGWHDFSPTAASRSWAIFSISPASGSLP